MLVCTQVAIASGANDVAAGIAAYNKGDFASATSILNNALLTQKENAIGHYYLANAYLRQGNRVEAMKHYQIALTQHPSADLSAYCQKAIKDYGGATTAGTGAATTPGTTTSANPATAKAGAAKSGSKNGFLGIVFQDGTVYSVFPGSPSEKAGIKAKDRILMINGISTHMLTEERVLGMLTGDVGTTVNLSIDRSGKRYQVPITRAEPVEEMRSHMATQTAATKKAQASSTADDFDKTMIVIHKHTGDTDAVYAQVITALSLIPRHVKEELSNFGTKIVIARTLVDANPEMRHEKPRGYIHGGGYDNCPGMYTPNNKQIFVGERASWHNSPPQLNHWVKSTMLHEMGHAYDHCRSDESGSSSFKAAYQKDFQHLSLSEKNEHYYYCQEGDAGPSELFAELFALNLSSAGGIDERSPSLGKSFPSCLSYIQSFVGK